MLDLQLIFLAIIVALLLAISVSLKVLFHMQRSLVRMEENIIRITAKLLEEEDEIELLLKEDLKTSRTTKKASKTSKKNSKNSKSKKANKKKSSSRKKR